MSNTDKLVERLLHYLDSAEAFAGKEIPAYVTEYLSYEAWYHQQWVLWGWIPFLLSFALFLVLQFATTKADDELRWGCFMLSIFWLFLCMATVPHSYFKLHKLKIAPRVYMVEELRK